MLTTAAGDMFADGKWHEESCDLQRPGGVACDCGLMEAIETVERAVLDHYLPADRVGLAVQSSFGACFVPPAPGDWSAPFADRSERLARQLRGEEEIGFYVPSSSDVQWPGRAPGSQPG